MRRGSRRAILVALVLPGVLTLVTLAVLLWLIPQAPAAIVMQWSGDGASRFAPPAELLFLPVIAMAASVLIWAVAPTGKPRDTRIGLIVGNGVNVALNSSAIALLASQRSGAATEALPTAALALSLIPVALVVLITFFATRDELV